MHAQPLIHWDRHLDHPPRRHVPDQRDAGERAGGKGLVAVDDVLIAADEDAQDAVAEEHAGGEGRPRRDGRGGGPAHPEHADGDGWRAEHAEPEAGFGGEAMNAASFCFSGCGFDAGEVFLRPGVDERDEEGGAAEAEADAEEGEAGESFRKAVDVGEDEGVAV